MQNKKSVVLIILSALAILSLIYGVGTPTKKRQIASSKDIDIQEKAPFVKKEKIVPIARGAKRTNYVFWGRNPFVPKATAAARTSVPILNGIMWDEKNPKAIINDIIVQKGDKINGNTVIEIGQNRVILNDGTANFELTLR